MKSITYLSKIWLVTIFISPLLYWPINMYINDYSLKNFSEFGPVLFASALGASILSLPTFMIIYLVYRKMVTENISENKIKFSVSMIGFLGVLVTFMILDSSIFSNLKSIFMPISYILCICISSLLFKISNDLEKTNFG